MTYSTRQIPPTIYGQPRHHPNRALKTAAGVLLALILLGAGYLVDHGLHHSTPGPTRPALQARLLTQTKQRFPQSGVRSVTCLMPSEWVPGRTFTCYLYAANSTEVGTVQGTVLPSTGSVWRANDVWYGFGAGA